jgi:hypothetical protein
MKGWSHQVYFLAIKKLDGVGPKEVLKFMGQFLRKSVSV